MFDDRELTPRCAVRMAETLRAQVTVATRRLRCFETGNAIAIEEHVFAGVVELLPCGTVINDGQAVVALNDAAR